MLGMLVYCSESTRRGRAYAWGISGSSTPSHFLRPCREAKAASPRLQLLFRSIQLLQLAFRGAEGCNGFVCTIFLPYHSDSI